MVAFRIDLIWRILYMDVQGRLTKANVGIFLFAIVQIFSNGLDFFKLPKIQGKNSSREDL